MTSISESDSLDNSNSRRNRYDFKLLLKIIDTLGQFENNYNKKFNFSKMAQCLRIPNSEIDEIIDLLLNFQNLFESVFNNHRIKKSRLNNQIYLTVDEKDEEIVAINDIEPKKISISSEHLKLFNDIIYVFKFVNRGKGFDISDGKTELLDNLKELKNTHPYLFEGNGITYPTKLGIELGDLIISYNKSNRHIKNLTIGNYTFMVEEDG
ncbi:hypothetical protein LCGC14_2902160 [marine sediment metagenome]|uniref:Uncharacterized protein n=1 Tax=marine sediment metagenome TaxID=412755 RepID=A0A0F8XUH3_9ZZZZ